MEIYNNGYLELILGPMFSGKTSQLTELYKQCNFCSIRVIVINHTIDNRYTDETNVMVTHDKLKVPCIKTSLLSDIWYERENEYSDVIHNSEVILINEGQFFEDLYEVVYDMVQNKKVVYVCGLDGDFERKKFGKILDLIPICDKVTKLTSLCSLCKNGTKGIFSLRLTNEHEQIKVGSDDYIPVCRSCYDKNKK